MIAAAARTNLAVRGGHVFIISQMTDADMTDIDNLRSRRNSVARTAYK